MFGQQEDELLVETIPLPIQEISEDRALTETKLPPTPKPPFKISKPEIRTSLRALTTEGGFATVFYSIIGGALLSNFLLDLGASTVEIGLLASIPQLTNLLQPLGAYLGDRHQEPPLVFPVDFRLVAAAVVADCARDLVGQHISYPAAPAGAVDIGNYLPE
jgi:hypothetical protein